MEAKNLKELNLDELIGSLLTHELMFKPLIREKEKKKKIKEQGVDVNIIALKSFKSAHNFKKLQKQSIFQHTCIFHNFHPFKSIKILI
ncbi:hypothetical protein GQ457_06G011760 [Hibiscus cannabinus]